jgi:type IV secretory pathway TrbF-like protein
MEGYASPTITNGGTMDGSHNPYLAAQHIHNERYLTLTKSIRNWQLVGGALLLANVGLSGGIVYVTQQQQIAPYVVEVDAAGAAAAIKELRAETVQDPLVISSLLKRWLVDIRTISTDAAMGTRQMNAAYRMSLAPAQKYLSAYYHENPLNDLLKQGRTFLSNISIVPLTEKTWRARWKEQTLGEDGTVKVEREWEATIEVALVLPQNKEERQFSPLGVWVASLQWAEV